tara:strand:+ start:91 stop:249 length:159 start_codon:yes stop_codon:yes gene_type:complete
MNANKIEELEKTKDEILKKIAEKVSADPNKGEEFGASHTSHSSSGKHSSSTH